MNVRRTWGSFLAIALFGAFGFVGCNRRQPAEVNPIVPSIKVNRTKAPLGSALEVTYTWTVEPGAKKLDQNYWALVHFLDNQEVMLFSDDHQPEPPPSTWEPGKTYSYTATQNDTNFDQIAQKLAAIINADTTLDVTAINGVASLQLVGDSNDAPFTVVSTVNGQLPELTQGFFTNTDRYTFAVNAELLGGTQQLKKNSAADVVTARAVSALKTLAGLTIPLLEGRGEVLAIKGRSAAEEIEKAEKIIRRLGGTGTSILTVGEGLLEEPTTVVRIVVGS